MLTKLIFNTSLLYFYNNKNKLVIHKNSCHFCWRESRLLTHIICLLPSTSLSNNWHQGWHGVDGVFCGLHAPGCGVDHPEPPSAVTRGDPGGVVRAVSASAPVHPSLPLPGDPAPFPAPSQPPEPLTAGDSDEWGKTKRRVEKDPRISFSKYLRVRRGQIIWANMIFKVERWQSRQTCFQVQSQG